MSVLHHPNLPPFIAARSWGYRPFELKCLRIVISKCRCADHTEHHEKSDGQVET